KHDTKKSKSREIGVRKQTERNRAPATEKEIGEKEEDGRRRGVGRSRAAVPIACDGEGFGGDSFSLLLHRSVLLLLIVLV
ncbi:hypothetical protein A2U01_0055347, partial [Trifolium medium]|nr:hypothetical protein [Trifolium medium]